MKKSPNWTILDASIHYLNILQKSTLRLALAFVLMLGGSQISTPVSAQAAFEVGANTNVYFSDTLNPLVLEDKSGSATLDQVRKRLSEFKPADTIGPIDPKSNYWVVQKLVNRIGENRDFIVDAARTNSGVNWLRYQHYVVYPDGHVRELNGLYSENVPLLMNDIDPYVFTMDTLLSRSPVFTLHKDSEVQLFSKLKSNSTYPAVSFSMRLYDRTTYLELRKYGLYIEGILAGLLLALIISTWNNLYYKRDAVSLIYGIWLVLGWLQIMTMPIHDGQRLFEFFLIGFQNNIGILHSNIFWVGLFSYLQIIFYVLFGRTFLATYRYFPRFHLFTNIWIGIQALHFVVAYFFEHEIPNVLFWIPLFILQTTVLVGLLICAISRYRQGLKAARFAIVSLMFYLPFWFIFLLNLTGLLHINDYLPSYGLGLFVKGSFIMQAFAICVDAIVFNLGVQSRSRAIEKKLGVTIQAQKEAVENQNKILESTVEDRTRELQTQHKALTETHNLVVSSVNYASRLQRGQLPRAQRIENRFSSFATLWEPRDTIGGDLWWVSSSQRTGPFILAVADCTGHGVPGAMLSLLVSNSLERIYANSTAENPATALISLDHYVRTGLNQDRAESESDDGCDAVVLRIDRENKTIEFAGAKIGLFQMKANGEVIRYSVARCSLGYIEAIPEADKPKVAMISFAEGDLFAIVTDGFTDQIGGSGVKKVAYGYRRLESLLQNNKDADAQTMASCMQEDFKRWQGTEVRRDDVTAVVFRV